MMLLTAIVAAILPQRVTPAITPIEALAVADWFCRSVGAKVPTDQFDVSFNSSRGPTDNYGCYRVIFGKEGAAKMSVQVDGISGDVTHASVWPHPSRMVDADMRRSNEWLKKLGRSKDLLYDARQKRYATALDGKMFFNLNGWTRAEFRTQDGAFAYYYGIGELPPKPTGKPTISADRAIDIAYASEKNGNSPPFDPVYMKAEKGLFYDEKSASTRWVWRVLWLRAKGNADSVVRSVHVDAESGRVVPDQDYQNSRFMYRARAPRVGLAVAKPLKFNAPLLAKAESLLKVLGQSMNQFTSFETQGGLRMRGPQDTEFEMGPSGDLRMFRTRSVNSQAPAQSLDWARKIVPRLYPKLPEGAFTTDSVGRIGGASSRVYYRQRALGYDFLNREVVEIQFDASGKVVSYQANGASQRPTALPKKMLTKADIEAIAMKLAAPHVQPSTPKVRHYAQARALQIGWYPNGVGTPRLCYYTSVMFMRDVKNWAVQGGGASYPFDAETGACLRKFP